MIIKVISKPVGYDVTIGKVYKVVAEYERLFTIMSDSNGTLDILKDDCEVINGHPHADLIMKYAEIAQHDAEPWKYYEELISGTWCNCQNHLCFYENLEYRLKPRTININGFEVPEPLRNEPSDGTDYYVLDMSEISEMKWTSDVSEHQWLKAGIIHLTREAAEKHLEALLSFTKV